MTKNLTMVEKIGQSSSGCIKSIKKSIWLLISLLIIFEQSVLDRGKIRMLDPEKRIIYTI